MSFNQQRLPLEDPCGTTGPDRVATVGVGTTRFVRRDQAEEEMTEDV